MQKRPPVVVVLGHVDHGKTSLLDRIRSTQVTKKEAGGITQGIGTYEYVGEVGGNKVEVTFIDTPGHAAFSAMRARGGKVADIALLVVAASEGIMPQTKEAIEVIKNAKLPVIVAANKIDLPDASVDMIKAKLAELEIISEDYGGDVPVIGVSAKTGAGIESLMEMIQIVSELNPLESDPDGELGGIVIESGIDKSRGPIGVLLIKNGTLHKGDVFMVDGTSCKVRGIVDNRGENTESLGLSKVGLVMGFEAMPGVGAVIGEEKIAKQENNKPHMNRRGVNASEDWEIILKADKLGSLEAISACLPRERLKLLASGVGEISESDILDASSWGVKDIYSFNLKTPASVKKLADNEKIGVRNYEIIYELLADIEKRLKLFVDPESGEETLGRAEVLAVFSINGEKIAGCKVKEGKISKNERVHVKRDEKTVWSGKIRSLKKGKEDALEAKQGEECGILLRDGVDLRVGDVVLSYKHALDDL